MIEQLAKL
ncbi:hypothetical protein SAMN04489868_103104 [Pisciglobus halotolerans]|uniref:Uncharacterized protein n=1 Tax=Pisciglobus halotolerans TaxID=745365 RepID=A0A1I3B423_9LACT|nr:hypothetical protein SAMN04489868_103104 [Pisciglobus halotolerans]